MDSIEGEPVKVTKKRKASAEDDVEREELRHAARTLCTCSEQWRIISRYPTSRLREFVENQKFESDRKIGDDIVSRGISLLGHVLDKLLSGESYIQQEFEADTALQTSVKQEVGGLLRYLNNKVRIAWLCTNNVATGIAKKPAAITMQEEKNKDALDLGVPGVTLPGTPEISEEAELSDGEMGEEESTLSLAAE